MNTLIELTEHDTSEPITLNTVERDHIIATLPNATITPVPGTTDQYTINPRNYIGLINTGHHTIHIAPKIGISRALFLITYALNPNNWRDTYTPADDDLTLNEAIAIPFTHHTHNATRRHLLHGYQTIDDTLHGIKGRIRFNDQLRRHQRLTVPIEVSYDEHTPDITENRILLAALHKLNRLQRLTPDLQHDIKRLTRNFTGVTPTTYNQQHIPTPHINRLNQHYAPALALAELILTNRTLELAPGTNTNNSLLFDMSTVFETFVHTALREALHLTPHQFPRAGKQPLYLDTAHHIRLKPDISWWQHSTCTLIGDIKYKKTISGDGNNADLYQALAYANATQLTNATLIYASSENPTATHTTIDGTTIHIEALNLNGTPHEILDEIKQLASRLTNRQASLPLQNTA